VSGLGPCATAVTVAGEDELMGCRETESTGAYPAAAELEMVAETDELPESPLLLVAVAVI
jgi:hypothetical protein